MAADFLKTNTSLRLFLALALIALLVPISPLTPKANGDEYASDYYDVWINDDTEDVEFNAYVDDEWSFDCMSDYQDKKCILLPVGKSTVMYFTDMTVASASNANFTRLDSEQAGSDDFYGSWYSVTPKAAGQVKFTCQYYDYYGGADRTYVVTAHAASIPTSIPTQEVTVSDSYSNAQCTISVPGLPKNAYVDVDDGYVSKQAQGSFTIKLDGGKGTYKLEVQIGLVRIPLKIVVKLLKVKAEGTYKYIGSISTAPGKKTAVTLVLGKEQVKAAWASSNSKVAKVNKKGVIRAVKKGRCFVTASFGQVSKKFLVEVTSKKAYKAVMNGFEDYNTKLTYSQSKRMSAKCRDCSSFVSRCYYDASLGRRIFTIGQSDARTWAYTAAYQAQWLNSHGKRVALKAVKESKLRPGDTIYYQTGYAGLNKDYRHIDHAALYVGNGLCLNTGYGPKGTIGLRWYSSKDSSVRFIGRPCK